MADELRHRVVWRAQQGFSSDGVMDVSVRCPRLAALHYVRVQAH